MRCPSCKTRCLDTDTRCLNCRQLIHRPPERSAAHVCGFLFATFGVAAFVFGPATTRINENQALLAGIGGLVGGIVGVVVGLIIDRVSKAPNSEPDRRRSPPRVKPR